MMAREGEMPCGVFVTFEGADGVGKSTQIAFLRDLLVSIGREVLCIREPGGTAIGEKLRAVLLDPMHNSMSARAELLIYEACRAQIVDEVITPALERGAVVLCDRFSDSTFAYQGYGRGMDLDVIARMDSFATGGLVPDATILITCADNSEASTRVERRQTLDRLELEGQQFKQAVNEAFLARADADPQRIRHIQSCAYHSQTACAIIDALKDVLPCLADIPERELEERLCVFDAAHMKHHVDRKE